MNTISMIDAVLIGTLAILFIAVGLLIHENINIHKTVEDNKTGVNKIFENLKNRVFDNYDYLSGRISKLEQAQLRANEKKTGKKVKNKK